MTAAVVVSGTAKLPARHHYVDNVKAPGECKLCGRQRFVADGVGGAADTHPLGEKES